MLKVLSTLNKCITNWLLALANQITARDRDRWWCWSTRELSFSHYEGIKSDSYSKLLPIFGIIWQHIQSFIRFHRFLMQINLSPSKLIRSLKDIFFRMIFSETNLCQTKFLVKWCFVYDAIRAKKKKHRVEISLCKLRKHKEAKEKK